MVGNKGGPLIGSRILSNEQSENGLKFFYVKQFLDIKQYTTGRNMPQYYRIMYMCQATLFADDRWWWRRRKCWHRKNQLITLAWFPGIWAYLKVHRFFIDVFGLHWPSYGQFQYRNHRKQLWMGSIMRLRTRYFVIYLLNSVKITMKFVLRLK